jgi:hypothetical protein
MWKRLPSSQINLIAWDACVQQDPAGLVYALSWYLNAVAPSWEGWVLEEKNSYQAVIPIATRKIAGLKIVSQPLLTQQLGMFTSQPALRFNNWQTVWPLFLKSKLSIEHYCFQKEDFTLVHQLIPLQERPNLILPLNQDYSALKAKYTTNRLRDLHKAIRNYVHLQSGHQLWPQVLALYQQNILPQLSKKQQVVLNSIIPRLVEAAVKNQCAQTWVLTLPNGEIVAGALFLFFKNRITYLLPATSVKGKKIGANTYLLDQILRQFAGSDFVLDFEGSGNTGIADFFKSFGAQPEIYGLLHHHNFSLPLKVLFTLKKWFKAIFS